MMKFSTRLVVLTAVAAVLLGAAVAFAGDKDAESKEVTLTGEVLDLYCYMKNPDSGQGDEHAKCANSCISRGLPIGFLADGVVYLIIGTDHKSAAEMVAGMAGRSTRVTGMLVEHDGVKAIELLSIEEAKKG